MIWKTRLEIELVVEESKEYKKLSKLRAMWSELYKIDDSCFWNDDFDWDDEYKRRFKEWDKKDKKYCRLQTKLIDEAVNNPDLFKVKQWLKGEVK